MELLEEMLSEMLRITSIIKVRQNLRLPSLRSIASQGTKLMV